MKEVFLEISQNSQKTPVAESFFNKVASLTLQRYYKETLEQVFSSEFSVIFKKTCLQNTSERLFVPALKNDHYRIFITNLTS